MSTPSISLMEGQYFLVKVDEVLIQSELRNRWRQGRVFCCDQIATSNKILYLAIGIITSWLRHEL